MQSLKSTLVFLPTSEPGLIGVTPGERHLLPSFARVESPAKHGGTRHLAGGCEFGDGVACVARNRIRLRQKLLSGGAASFPDASDTVTLSARGGTPVGSGLTAHYAVYYRNAASFCTPATFNVSNGWRITW